MSAKRPTRYDRPWYALIDRATRAGLTRTAARVFDEEKPITKIPPLLVSRVGWFANPPGGVTRAVTAYLPVGFRPVVSAQLPSGLTIVSPR